MSESLTTPRSARSRVDKQDPEAKKFKEKVYKYRGWKSRNDAQTAQKTEMTRTADEVQAKANAAFAPNADQYSSKALSDKKLQPGKEFRTFLSKLQEFESASAKTRDSLTLELQSSAMKYMEHYSQHSERLRNAPINKTKNAACGAVIGKLARLNNAKDLKQAITNLGDPPWDSQKARGAASLKATLDFESLPAPVNKAEVLGGEHVSPAFWVNRADGGSDSGKQKTYLFKPMSTGGDGSGADVAREAIAGRVGDIVTEMTEMELGIPETHMISLPQSKFGEGALDPSKVAGLKDAWSPVVGSLQQFARTEGELAKLEPSQMKRIPPGACQKIIVADMLTLNTDRHGGNILLKPGAGKSDGSDADYDLVPIDHGLAFPPRDHLSKVQDRLGDMHSAILVVPAAHEPFTDETIKALNALDPDAYASALRRERATLAKSYPDQAKTLENDNIDMSRRAAMFLKQAVAHDPALTPAAAQVAFGQHSKDLLEKSLSDRAFARLAEEIITLAAEQQDALKEYCMMPGDQRSRMDMDLATLGWPESTSRDAKMQHKADRKWLLSNPRLALDLYTSQTKPNVNMNEERKKWEIAKPTEWAAELRRLSLEMDVEDAIHAVKLVGADAEEARNNPIAQIAVLQLALAQASSAGEMQSLDMAAEKVMRHIEGMAMLAQALPDGDELQPSVEDYKKKMEDYKKSRTSSDLPTIDEVDIISGKIKAHLKTSVTKRLEVLKTRLEVALKETTRPAMRKLREDLKTSVERTLGDLADGLVPASIVEVCDALERDVDDELPAPLNPTAPAPSS